MKILSLILTLISFQFLITGCSGGVLFGGDDAKSKIQQNSVIAPSLGNASPESLSKINDDDEPTKPAVKFIIPPGDSIFGVNLQVVFEVIRGDNDIIEVSCSVNGQVVPCEGVNIQSDHITGRSPEQGTSQPVSPDRESTPIGGSINLGPMGPGTHELQIIATDKEGNTHETKEQWSVYSDFRLENQSIQVASSKNKIDILFVVDNSFSMRHEQRKLGDGFKNFISQLKDLDWRIGITTTDGSKERHYLAYENVTGDQSPELLIADWRDGRLADLYGAGFWDQNTKKYNYLTPNVKNVQKVFSRNIKRKETGSKFEQGIYTTYRAIERAVANNGNVKENRILNEFFRQDAALAVVVISDEDDSGSEERNRPENLIAHVKRSFGEDKVFQFHSIIAHTQSCINGNGKTYGYNYEKLSRLTGGIVGDICFDKYDRMLANIGKGLSSLTKTTYQIKCIPQDIDNDGIANLQITPKNPGLNIPGYTINGSHVQFDESLESGNYDLTYYCL